MKTIIRVMVLAVAVSMLAGCVSLGPQLLSSANNSRR